MLEFPWRSPWNLFFKKLQASNLKVSNVTKKDFNSCFPVKFVKFLRAPDFKGHFKEYLRTTACESKFLWCIVFIKAIANITSRCKVLSNYLLFLFFATHLILQFPI